jgi:hypothetical protein
MRAAIANRRSYNYSFVRPMKLSFRHRVIALGFSDRNSIRQNSMNGTPN